MGFNIKKIRSDFPILGRKVNGKDFIYFDNAATSQKPNIVINSKSNNYRNYNSNKHRGVHSVSQEATEAYESARVKIQKHFIKKYMTDLYVKTRIYQKAKYKRTLYILRVSS